MNTPIAAKHFINEVCRTYVLKMRYEVLRSWQSYVKCQKGCRKTQSSRCWCANRRLSQRRAVWNKLKRRRCDGEMISRSSRASRNCRPSASKKTTKSAKTKSKRSKRCGSRIRLFSQLKHRFLRSENNSSQAKRRRYSLSAVKGKGRLVAIN